MIRAVRKYLLLSCVLTLAAPAVAAQTPHNDMFGVWSPDGGRIAFISDRTGDWEIYTVSADGSGLKRLTDAPGRDAHPFWSPDGKRIAFQSPRHAGHTRVFVMNADGSDQGVVARTTGFCGVPAWSPDGRQIALMCSTAVGKPGSAEAPWRLFLMDADGGKLRQVSHGPGNDQVPNWSGDGKRLVFFSNRSGSDQIHELDIASGAVSQLTTGPESHRVAAYMPGGGLLMISGDGPGAVVLRTPEGGYIAIKATESIYGVPVVSRNGRILYQDVRGEAQRLFTMNIDGSGAIELQAD